MAKMESSTPIPNRLRKSFINVSKVSSPLRRSVAEGLSPVVLLVEHDDEAERLKRRSVVDTQRKLTNVSSGSVLPSFGEVNQIVNENQIKDHLKICAKLYTENKISVKNAWELYVIDVIKKISVTNTENVLQVAGKSLDVGAKVYAFRVDDIHTKGLKIVGTMGSSHEDKDNQNLDDTDDNNNDDGQMKKKHVAKRKKRMNANKNTVDKEGKNLFGVLKMLEPVTFSTKENIDVGATDNLLTCRLPVNPANQLFMLLTGDKYWVTSEDITLKGTDQLYDIDLPDLYKSTLCAPFKEFEIGNWDPDTEEQELGNCSIGQDVVYDDNGLPLPELDGSIHNIFENNDDIHDSNSDIEEHQTEFQAQILGEIANIVDVIPEENRVESDYGYNAFIKTESGKFIDRIWAGPSHWKVKFVKRSSARFSGNTVQQITKHCRKVKVQEKVNFDSTPFDMKSLPKKVIKRTSAVATFEKVTLPVPDIACDKFCNVITEFLIKSGVPKPRLNNVTQKDQDYDVPAYNYENPNDSQYCSNTNSDGVFADDPVHNTFEEEDAPVACIGANLVNEPEMVSAVYVPYAMQAKKMDMKKLKASIWKKLTQNSQLDEHPEIRSMTFSQLYKELPDLLSKDMRKDLSCPLALVALLHLCNENSLELIQPLNDGCKDFKIEKVI